MSSVGSFMLPSALAFLRRVFRKPVIPNPVIPNPIITNPMIPNPMIPNRAKLPHARLFNPSSIQAFFGLSKVLK